MAAALLTYTEITLGSLSPWKGERWIRLPFHRKFIHCPLKHFEIWMQGQFQQQNLLRFDFSIIDKKQEIVQNAKSCSKQKNLAQNTRSCQKDP